MNHCLQHVKYWLNFLQFPENKHNFIQKLATRPRRCCPLCTWWKTTCFIAKSALKSVGTYREQCRSSYFIYCCFFPFKKISDDHSNSLCVLHHDCSGLLFTSTHKCLHFLFPRFNQQWFSEIKGNLPSHEASLIVQPPARTDSAVIFPAFSGVMGVKEGPHSQGIPGSVHHVSGYWPQTQEAP